jgi:hypothetical protein
MTGHEAFTPALGLVPVPLRQPLRVRYKAADDHVIDPKHSERLAPLVPVLKAITPDGAFEYILKYDYKKNKMRTDRESGRGNKRARVTRGSRNPNHGKRKHYIARKPSKSN